MSQLIDALRAVPRRPTGGLAALALAGAVLSACGGSSASDATAGTTASAQSSSAAAAPSGGTTSGSSAEAVTATEADFSISLGEDHLKAGDYTITVKNDGHATHDLRVEQNGSDVAKSDIVRPGDSTTLTVTLKPGKYVFYCSIGNHRAMGMQTTVTVS